SIKSTLKAYSLPIILLAAALFFQLVVLPRNYPPSYYDGQSYTVPNQFYPYLVSEFWRVMIFTVLGIPRYSSVEQVIQAYENINAKWYSNILFQVQYAYELLTNEYTKRDYDVYNIDEHSHLLEKVKESNLGKHISGIDLPLIKLTPFDPADRDVALISSENFLSKFEDDKALLIQIISFGSSRSAQLSNIWKRAVYLLNDIVNSGVVELADVNLVGYLAERKPRGQPFFRKGLPAFVAFPAGCKSSSCLLRFDGDPSVDSITDWVATEILNLPRIPYYSKDSLVQKFLGKSKPHQVKVILISKTGERASPFVRQASKNYLNHMKFALALWKEEDSAFWLRMFGVDSPPAIVILKDPGVEPVVYRGKSKRSVNASMFSDVLAKNKHFVLPQLRNLTSAELGCDARGYSRSGRDTKIWYCAIVTGRPSLELNRMRETMRRVQEKLLSNESEDPRLASASLALREKRLTFAWLDGESQNRYCFFHIHSEDSFETCGPRRGINDVARLFIVRFERNDEEEENSEPPTTAATRRHERNVFFASWHQPEEAAADPTSSLVAKYNGSNDVSEMTTWISQTVRDGDSRNISPFRTTTPPLVPEDNGETWTKSSKKLIGIPSVARSFVSGGYDRLTDPRIGPSLLLVALLAFGRIWLNRSR
ncbi:hypothetical protein M569_05158, partial [Genlisea aurea]